MRVPSSSLGDLGRSRPHAVSRARARRRGRGRRPDRSSKARRCPSPSPTIRASASTGFASPQLRFRVERSNDPIRLVAGLSTRCAASLRLWRDADDGSQARPGSRPEPAGVSDAARRVDRRCGGAACDSSSTGTTSGTRSCALRLGRRHPAVRLARWFERRDARARPTRNLCVSRGFARFLASGSACKQAPVRVLYDRPASTFAPIDRARTRTDPPGALRAAGHPNAVRARLHRLPDELDRGRRFRRRHRRRPAARGPDPRTGRRASPGRRFPESRDPRHRRRRTPRRVRAAVCGAAGAAGSAANALARARRLPARRRQRRSRPLPASIVVGPRHSDEGRRSVRRRRAGVRARLRRVPGRARAPRRQRPAVLDRPAAGRRAVRPVRAVSRRSERSIGCAPARAVRRGRRGKKAGRARRNLCSCPTMGRPCVTAYNGVSRRTPCRTWRTPGVRPSRTSSADAGSQSHADRVLRRPQPGGRRRHRPHAAVDGRRRGRGGAGRRPRRFPAGATRR